MKNSKKLISAMLTLALTAGTLVSAVSPVNAAGNKVYKPVVVNHNPKNEKIDANGYLNIIDRPQNIDPTSGSDVQSWGVAQQVFEGLARQDKDANGNIVAGPGMAERWEITPDGKTYTFFLRDAKWSDGKPVTAKDFEYSFLKILGNDLTGYGYFMDPIVGAEAYRNKKGKVSAVGIKALSAKKLQIKMVKPFPLFNSIVSFPIFCAVRKDDIQKIPNFGTTTGWKGIHSDGPFKVTKWVYKDSMVLEKNPMYWDAKNVKISKININLKDLEQSATVQMFTQGQLDRMAPSRNYIALLDGKVKSLNLSALKEPMRAEYYFHGGAKSKYLSNKNIRLAFMLALDREANIKYLKNNYAAYGLVPYSVALNGKEYRKVVPEPLKALYKKYPNKAAWKALFVKGLQELKMDPDPAKHTIVLAGNGGTNDMKLLYELYQSQFTSALGCKVELKMYTDYSQYKKTMQSHDYDIARNGWTADYDDPQTFLDLFTSDAGMNWPGYKDATVDKLVDQMRFEVNPEKRKQQIVALEARLVNEGYVMPLQYDRTVSFHRGWVRNLNAFDVGGNFDFKFAFTVKRK